MCNIHSQLLILNRVTVIVLDCKKTSIVTTPAMSHEAMLVDRVDVDALVVLIDGEPLSLEGV